MKRIILHMIATFILLGFFGVSQSAFNPQINYQGKLTDATDMGISNGGKCVKFRLMDSLTGGVEQWNEEWKASTSYATTTNGLFSVMLGTHQSIASVDFNQNLYLEVQFDPGCDGTYEEVFAPRKIIGTVPSAFEAGKLDGIDSAQFLRSDTYDTMNASTSQALLTVQQDGSGDILNINDGSTEVFTILDGGNIGIGNNTPTALLHIGDSGGTSGKINFEASDGDLADITINTSDDLLFEGANRYRFDANLLVTGNYVATDQLILGYDGTVASITTNETNEDLTIDPNGTGNIIIQGNTGIGTTTPAGILSIATSTGASVLHVGQNGYVGIGTESPNTNLHVVGSIRGTTSGVFNNIVVGPSNEIYASGASGALQVNTSYIGVRDIPLLVGTTTVAGMFSVASSTGASALHVGQDGNIGIGTTSPSTKLTVAGDVYFGNQATLNGGTPKLYFADQGSKNWQIRVNGDDMEFWGNNAANEYVTFRDGGNVGIGTTTPSGILTVATSTGNPVFHVDQNNNIGIGTNNPSYGLEVKSDDGTRIYNSSNGSIGTLKLGTMSVYVDADSMNFRNSSNVSQMYINSSSNVGIGTTTPTSKLTIQSSGDTSSTYGLNIADSNSNNMLLLRDDSRIKIGISADTTPDRTVDIAGNVTFDDVEPPTLTSMVAALAGLGAGNVDDGEHYYAVAYVTADGGVTGINTPVTAVTVTDKSSDGQVSLTNIPTSPDPRVVSRRLYRSTAGGNKYLTGYYLATISDNTTTVYTDNIADSALDDSDYVYRKANTTAGLYYLDNTQFMQATDVYHTSLGLYALGNNTKGYNVTAIGGYAAAQNTTGTDNTSVGYYSLFGNQTGSSNTAMGSSALGVATGISFIGNTAFGANALSGIVADDNYNTAIGRSAGSGFQGTGNILVGSYAGSITATTTGNYNTFIGYDVGDNIAAGADNNILLGFQLDLQSAAGDNQLSIGNLIFGNDLDGTGTTVSTGNIGIGTTTPSEKLTVAGNIAPSSNLTHDLGTSDLQWNNLYVNNIVGGTINPSFSTGSIAFASTSGALIEDNANFYWDDTNNRLGLGTNTPSADLEISGTGNVLLLPQEDTASAPTLAFGDGDTGFYEESDDLMRMSIGGNARWTISNTAIQPYSVGGSVKYTGSYGNTTIHLGHNADLDTGLAQGAADQLSLVAGGTEQLRFTQNDSLNDTAYFTGDVGIGTSTPDTLLTIAQGADSNALKLYGYDDKVTSWGSNYMDGDGFYNVDTDTRFQYRIGGNLLAQAFGDYFDIYSSASLTRYLTFGNGKMRMTYNDASTDKFEFSDSASNLFYSIEDKGTDADFYFNGNFGIGTSTPAGILSIATSTGAPVFHVGENGYVGIGTESPTQALQVVGNAKFTPSSGNAVLYIDGYGTNSANINFRNNGGVALSGIYGDNAKRLVFQTNGATEVMRIDATGDMGLGTTTPDARLAVVSNGTTSASKAFMVSNSDLSPLFRIDDDGQVGIGNVTPAYELHVSGTAYSTQVVGAGTSIQSPKLTTWSGSDDLTIEARSGRGIIFNTNGSSEIARMTSDGSFGIGTTTPAGILSIATSTGEPVFHVMDNGNVGVGNNNPSNKLDVLVNGGSDRRFYVTDTTGDGTGSVKIGASVGALFLTAASGSDIQSYDNFIPTSDNNFDLGATTRYWKDAYINNLNIGTGINMGFSTGSIAFASTSGALIEDNTNFYWDDTNNRLGLGTTEPGAKLEINNGTLTEDTDSLRLTTISGGQNEKRISFYGGANGTYPQAYIGSTINPSVNNGDLRFGTAESSTFYERMRITNEGKLGIGTTTPSGAVHIYTGATGTITPSASADELVLEGSGETGMSIFSPDASTNYLIFGSNSDDYGAGLKWNHNNDVLTIGTANTDGYIRFDTDNQTEAMRITSDGKLGIGTTTPKEILHVMENASGGTPAQTTGTVAIFQRNDYTTREASISIIGGDTGSSNINFGDNGTVQAGKIAYNHESNSLGFSTNIGERLTIDSAGDVGIGTTTPDEELVVLSNGEHGNIVVRAPTGYEAKLQIQGSGYDSNAEMWQMYASGDNSASDLIIGNGSIGTMMTLDGATGNAIFEQDVAIGTSTIAGILSIATSTGAPVFHVADSGNVGIGTASPLSALNINKTGTITSGLSFGDGDTGWYESSDDAFNLDIGGSNEIDINGSFLTVNATNAASLRLGSVDATLPSYGFNGDTDTGMFGLGSDIIGFTTGGTEQARLDASGRLGLGTTTPTGMLSIATSSGNPIFQVADSGNVGIGTDSPGSSLPNSFSTHADSRLLQISSASANYSSGLLLRRGDNNTGLDIWNNGAIGTSYIDNRYNNDSINGGIIFRTKTTSTPVEAMSIIGSGNVGIGTTTPTSKLTIQGSGDTSSTYGMNITDSGSNPIMVVRDDGKVGIGTDSPRMGLELYGKNIYADFVTYPSAPSGVAESGSGLEIGTYYYRVTYYTDDGETRYGSNSSAVVTTSGNQQVLLTIPTSTDDRVIGRKIYRGTVNSGYDQTVYVATVANNTDGTYTDTTADGSLGAAMAPAGDTTAGVILLDGTPLYQTSAIGTTFGYQAAPDGFGRNVTAFGSYAGNNLTYGPYNSLFGYYSGINITTGSENSLYGSRAGQHITTGSQNVGFGNDAFRGMNGEDNTGIGAWVGYKPDSSGDTSANNVYLGRSAGVSFGGSQNILIGHSAGSLSAYATSMNNNIMIGYDIGDNAETGASNNTLIGYQLDLQTAGGSNQLSIGNLIFGTDVDGTGTTLATGDIGIGNVAPSAKLHVTGDSAGDGIIISGASGVSNWLQFEEGTSDRGIIGNDDGGGIFTGNSANSFNIRSENDLHIGAGGDNILMTMNSTSVGIGTTSPTGILSVATSTGNPVLHVMDNGNVGIGTNAPTEELHVSKSFASGITTMRVENTSTAGGSAAALFLDVAGDSVGDPYVRYYIPGGAYWSAGVDNSDSNKFKIGNDSSPGGSTDLTIDTSGYVGIGTANPAINLDVYEDSGDAMMRITSNTDNSYVVIDSNDDGVGTEASSLLYRDNGSNMWGLNKDSSQDFVIYDYTRAANVLSIIDNGNMALMETGGSIGIGTTTPEYTLDVWGTAGTNPLRIASSSGSTMLTILQNGNVGIGTTTPTSQFTVVNPDNITQLSLQAGSSQGANNLFEVLNSSGGYLVTVDANGTTTATTILPRTDNTYNLGAASLRFANIYAATSSVGDLVFSNDFRFVEAPLTDPTQVLYLKNQNKDTLLSIDENMKMGIGTESMSHILTIGQGLGEAIADGWAVYSSQDYKEDIVSLGDNEYAGVLDTIGDMRFVRYKLRKDDTNKTYLGLITEESPEDIVASDGKSINLYEYISFIGAGLKELKQEVDQMKGLSVTTDTEGEIVSADPVSLKYSLASLGIMVGDEGVVEIANLKVKNGLTLMDKVTGEPYCIEVINGEMEMTPGDCQAQFTEEQDIPDYDVLVNREGSQDDIPETFIKEYPENSSMINDATFVFDSWGDAKNFHCQINNLGFEPCSDEKSYHNLQPGEYTFKVYAVGDDGRYDMTPAEWNWIVEKDPSFVDNTPNPDIPEDSTNPDVPDENPEETETPEDPADPIEDPEDPETPEETPEEPELPQETPEETPEEPIVPEENPEEIPEVIENASTTQDVEMS